MNTVVLSGRIEDVIEPRYTEKGLCVVNFSLIASKTVRKDAPETVSRFDYIPCIAFGKQAEILTNFATKGKKIYIKGKISSNLCTSKEGKPFTATEVVVTNFEYARNSVSDGQIIEDNFSTMGIEDSEF